MGARVNDDLREVARCIGPKFTTSHPNHSKHFGIFSFSFVPYVNFLHSLDYTTYLNFLHQAFYNTTPSA